MDTLRRRGQARERSVRHISRPWLTVTALLVVTLLLHLRLSGLGLGLVLLGLAAHAVSASLVVQLLGRRVRARQVHRRKNVLFHSSANSDPVEKVA